MACTTSTTNNEATQDGLISTATEVGYACAPSCDGCEAPASQTFTLNVNQGAAFSQVLAGTATTPQTVNPVSTDGWAISDVVGGQAVLTGNAPLVDGTYPQVVIVSNECGQATVVTKIVVSSTGGCTIPPNITRAISVNSNTRIVNETIGLTGSGHTIFAQVLPAGVSANVYGSELKLTGNYYGALPATYSVTLQNSCGNYSVSGTLQECIVILHTGSTGTSELEVGVNTNYCATLNGATITVIGVTGLPVGVSYAVTYPTATTSLICLTGAPTVLSLSGNIVFQLANQCGTSTLTMPYTKKAEVVVPCTVTAKTGESGVSSFEYGVAGSLCYAYTGQNLSLINAETPPLGLTLSISGSGPWTVCLSGTPVLDIGVGNGVSGTVDFQLSGDCGVTSHSIPYTIPAQVARPDYCIGVYEYDTTTNVLTVWGAAPNSTVSIVGATPSTLVLDSLGYGSTTLTATAVSPDCVEISHPTCALVRKQAQVLECP